MAVKRPLVITNGVVEQLQAGDYIASVDQYARINASGGALVIGTPVYAPSNGNMDKAQANALATSRVIGLVTDASVADAAAGGIQTDGKMTATTTQWDAVTGGSGGLLVNNPYYLDPASPGQMTTTAPTADGQFVAPLGVALSTTEFEITIERPIRL